MGFEQRKIQLQRLTKIYQAGKTSKKALDGVSFTLGPGLYGLLGPNGAGKSTMMNIITGNLDATGGRVLWNGENIVRLGARFRRVLGYMPQQQNLYDSFTGRRFLLYLAALKELPRADAAKEHMGLTSWEAAPDGRIVKADVVVAKNYLSEEEMRYLERIVSLYLDYAELQAERKIPMSMEDWAKRLDGFLEFNGNEILTGPGKISAEQAKLHAETEFEKYRIIQDKLFLSDYDRFIIESENSEKPDI